MSYPAWPEQLPRPDRDTFQRSRQDGRKKRRSDAGPSSYRRRFSSASKTVSLSIRLYRWQLSLFDEFYESTTNQGSGLFTMPDPTTDGWPLLNSAGEPMMSGGAAVLMSKTWLCAFGDQPPVDTLVGNQFRVSFSVEVMP